MELRAQGDQVVKSPLSSRLSGKARGRRNWVMVQLLGAAVLIGGLLAVVVATIASASAPTEGSSVPGSAVAVGAFTGNTPFSSGQGINVEIPANSIFSPT